MSNDTVTASSPSAVIEAQVEQRMEQDVLMAWLMFVSAMVVLMTFSAILLDPAEGEVMSAMSAVRRCIFWFLAGALFATFVWFHLGSNEAFSWVIGYTLEYALSFDNLFLFHIVFTSYGTPKGQVYRGIVTAMRLGIGVRYTLFFVSEEAFNGLFIFRWIFGLILIYSGVKVIYVDEEEDNPTDNCLVRLLTRYLPVHHAYADGSAFFVYNEVAAGTATANASVIGQSDAAESGRATCSADEEQAARSVDNSTSSPLWDVCCKGWKATPLLLAVLTLMIIDAVFAVDSVTAKVSMIYQYNDRIDFFLNFTSTAFAMLCMPSLFFIIVLLVNIFRFLKYGLGGILILIGLKLLVSEHIYIREDVSGLVLLSILGLSVLASLLVSDNAANKNPPAQAHKDDPEVAEVQLLEM